VQLCTIAEQSFESHKLINVKVYHSLHCPGCSKHEHSNTCCTSGKQIANHI